MVYKNFEVGDLLYRDNDESRIGMLKSVETGDDGLEELHVYWMAEETVTAVRPGGPTRTALYPARIDTGDVEPGDDLTPDWQVYSINRRDDKVQLKQQASGLLTPELDLRLTRLPEKAWMIDKALEFKGDWEKRYFAVGSVVKHKRGGQAAAYPLGLVVSLPHMAGSLAGTVHVMFAGESTEVQCQNLTRIAASMTDLSRQLEEERVGWMKKDEDRATAMREFRQEVGEVAYRYAAEHGWCGTVDEALEELGCPAPDPSVVFELTVKLQITATRTGGDPGDELKESFVANSLSVVEDGGGLRIGTDADWAGLVMSGKPAIMVTDLEKAVKA